MQITQAICGYIRGLWLLAETLPGLLSAGGFRSVSHFAAIVITYFFICLWHHSCGFKLEFWQSGTWVGPSLSVGLESLLDWTLEGGNEEECIDFRAGRRCAHSWVPPVSGESEHVCPRSLLGKHNYIALYLHRVAEPQIGFSIFFKCTYKASWWCSCSKVSGAVYDSKLMLKIRTLYMVAEITIFFMASFSPPTQLSKVLLET